MTLSITVDDNFYSETVRTEADGRIFHLKLTSIDPTSDPEAFFTSKDAVETYIKSIGNDDPRWEPESFIGIVNDDLTSKWYLIAPDGSFEKQCIFYNWNPLLRVKFTSKEEVESFARNELLKNPNYWHPYRTDAEQKADETPFEAEEVRRQRDALLNKYEWAVNSPDLTDDKKAEWKNYRQALRDLPDQSGFPWEADGMTWPTKPTS